MHVLLFGNTLCRQVHGLPKDWGPQHRWVRVEERADATCAMCKLQADIIAEAMEATRHPMSLLTPEDE